MGKVVEKFDFNKEGLIDYREFVAALRWPEKLVGGWCGVVWFGVAWRSTIHHKLPPSHTSQQITTTKQHYYHTNNHKQSQNHYKLPTTTT